MEKHLIVFSKSIIINLLSETFILELKPVFVSIAFMRLPFFKSIKKILERLSAATSLLLFCAKYIIGFNFFSLFE